MKAHPSDRGVLTRLIALGEKIVARPYLAAALLLDITEAEGDLKAAMRCPDPRVSLGAAEGIVVVAMKEIATRPHTLVDLHRYAFIVQHALPMLRDRLFTIVADRERRRAS